MQRLRRANKDRVVGVDEGELKIPEAAPRGDHKAEHDEVGEEAVDRVGVGKGLRKEYGMY